VRSEGACAEMDSLLAERASGDVPVEERSRLEAHLPACERCRGTLALYEDALRLAGGGPAGPGYEGGGRDLSSSTLRLWKRSRRRRAVGAAVFASTLAAAAAASLALAPGLLGKGAPQRAGDEAVVASWEPDVDGALEASGLRRDGDRDEEMSTVDVVLAAFDAAEQED
jgi:anti-sigma factor RsiW